MTHLTFLARCASDQRIFIAFVQSEHVVAVEYFLIDFQTDTGKKFGWELLHSETDGVRGAGISSVPNRGSSTAPSARGGKQLCLAPGGKQFRHGVVIKRGHSGLRSRIEFVL